MLKRAFEKEALVIKDRIRDLGRVRPPRPPKCGCTHCGCNVPTFYPQCLHCSGFHLGPKDATTYGLPSLPQCLPAHYP